VVATSWSANEPPLLGRQMLEVRDGKLLAKKSGKDLPSILTRHRSTQQNRAEIEALIEAFRRNISSGSLYQRKCIDCHDRARDFARNRLTIDQSILKGRYSGRVIEDFLKGHGRLTRGGGRTDDVDVEVAA